MLTEATIGAVEWNLWAPDPGAKIVTMTTRIAPVGIVLQRSAKALVTAGQPLGHDARPDDGGDKQGRP